MKFQGKDLVKSLGKRRIVNGVSLEVERGEVVGLFGPNGAGKTTSFLLMAGLVIPDSGTILLGNKDVTQLPLYKKARLGLRYLPQDPSVFRGMTAEENLMAVLEVVEPNRKRRHKHMESLLREFGLQKIRSSSVMVLSGGERRRVEIARALVGNPAFILLDEPCAGIDPKSIEELRELIHQVARRGVGVLITDHNVRDTLKIINRGYVLHQGSVIAAGTPDALAGSSTVREIYLGHSFSW